MRIVAVADTHLFHWHGEVPPGDVLVHAGDLCRGGELHELEEAARHLRALPHRHKIVVAGNHDWAFVRTPRRARAVLGEDVIYLQDAGVVIEGVRFWGSPWQPEFNAWAFNLPRGGAGLREKWAAIPSDVDVLITHGPPLGIGDRSAMGRQRAGCGVLRERVTELKLPLHLFGHIHDDGGAFPVGGTMFVNVTTWECERAATVIDYDVGTRRVELVSVPPAIRPTSDV